ncbi:UbiX family flavin prenyltransferase [Aurantimonas aggregata]|uniref:UbiX family flavin prenyltransferase n=1 Tax=Aurantimonas aggregata TaxID=2047720 RepID=UPI0031B60AE9
MSVEDEREPLAAIPRRKRLIVAITGASGAIYGVRALQLLRAVDAVETHVIVTPSARRTLRDETDYNEDDIRALADAYYSAKDIGAAVSSGSFKTMGMLVAPCSIKTLSGIANSYDDELTVRAADVCLKERRRVVLLVRETPLHAGHLEIMTRAAHAGAIIMPPVPAFYHRPETIGDLVDQTVGRALDLFDIELPTTKRWHGSERSSGGK